MSHSCWHGGRDAAAVERQARFAGPEPCQAESHVARLLHGPAPVIAATDYVRAVASQITSYITAPTTVLGTDGFGRSANRAALRRFFEVDRHHIAVAALAALARAGQINPTVVGQAADRFGVDRKAPTPWTV